MSEYAQGNCADAGASSRPDEIATLVLSFSAMSDPGTFERAFFRLVNGIVEPVVRAGGFSSGMMPAGLIVLETKGRASGRRRSIPLHAVLLGDHLFVSTVRRHRSQWFRNLSVDPDVRYWRGGEAREVRALIFSPDESPSPAELQELPQPVRCVVNGLSLGVGGPGWAFAVLAPRFSPPASFAAPPPPSRSPALPLS